MTQVQSSESTFLPPDDDASVTSTPQAPRDLDTRALYLQQISQYPLLTQEEELHYAQQFKTARENINSHLRQLPFLILAHLNSLNKDKNDLRIGNFIEINFPQDDSADIRELLQDVTDKLNALAGTLPNKLHLTPPDNFINDFWNIADTLFLRDSFYDICLNTILDDKKRPEYIKEKTWNAMKDDLQNQCALKQQARSILIERNLRFVISIAKNYVRDSISIQDLIQEGNIGLMRAVDRFDYCRGHRFSTYASYWIRQAITRSMTNHSRTIRISASTLKIINDIKKAEQTLLQKEGKLPTPENIADFLGMPRPKIRALIKMSQQPVSLQAALSENTELADIVPDEGALPPEEIVAQASLRTSIFKAMDKLDERERFTIIKRFGLEDDQPLTLVQIAELLKVSSERVRQIEAMAIKKLRQPDAIQYFDGYY